MIASLTGRLRRKAVDYLVLDVAGVGYQVSVPFSTFVRIPDEGDDVCLHIHTHVREDSLSLFGFLTEAEKDLFLLLIGVSGIGPKLALTILSSLSVDEIAVAIQSSDDQKLSSVPGIGKKTAARMVLELKDKAKHLISDRAQVERIHNIPDIEEDAISALVNLGYKKQSAEDAVRKSFSLHSGLTVEGLIKESLSLLMKRK